MLARLTVSAAESIVMLNVAFEFKDETQYKGLSDKCFMMSHLGCDLVPGRECCASRGGLKLRNRVNVFSRLFVNVC